MNYFVQLKNTDEIAYNFLNITLKKSPGSKVGETTKIIFREATRVLRKVSVDSGIFKFHIKTVILMYDTKVVLCSIGMHKSEFRI